jgi:hypothetical protein
MTIQFREGITGAQVERERQQRQRRGDGETVEQVAAHAGTLK